MTWMDGTAGTTRLGPDHPYLTPMPLAVQNPLSSLGRRIWSTVLDQAPEREVDDYAARQRKFDRDLWIIEVEDPRGRHLLDRDELS